MSDIQKGDASLRRVTIAFVVAGAVVGAALIALATAYRPAFEDWLKEDLRARARLVMGALAVATAGPVLGLSGYMWIFGRRIIRAERYPPPGLRVTHDTPVVIGDVARRRGRLLQVLAGTLAIVAAVLAGLLLRVVA